MASEEFLGRFYRASRGSWVAKGHSELSSYLMNAKLHFTSHLDDEGDKGDEVDSVKVGWTVLEDKQSSARA